MTKPDLLQMITDAEKQHKAKKIVKPGPEGEADPVLVVVPGLPQLLEQTCDFLQRYVVFGLKSQPTVIALWVAHTYFLDAFDFTPYLSITAPSKKSGKSTTLECLCVLTPNPWPISRPSEAVLFRKIDNGGVTLLLDEADTLFSGKGDNSSEPVRALLNSGFYRHASVPRCIGKDHQIHDFKVFCPKAIASIRDLPDTIRDRSVVIQLLREPRARKLVKRFRQREVITSAAPIVAGFKTLSADKEFMDLLQNDRPIIPEELDDRQADICEPLLAIATAAGIPWPDRSRKALVELCTGNTDDEDTGIILLRDIKAVFDFKDTDRLPTRELLQGLVNVETDGPWPQWWEHDLKEDRVKGPASKLAGILRRSFHIKPKTIRLDEELTVKGYHSKDFTVLFNKYLP